MTDPTPCYGLPELFESTIHADHRRAAVLCSDCPFREACRANLEATIAEWGYSSTRGPRGTWAGVLYTKSGPLAIRGAA